MLKVNNEGFIKFLSSTNDRESKSKSLNQSLNDIMAEGELLIKESLSKNPSFKKKPYQGYNPDFETMFRIAANYSSTKNFIIMGRGGSITGFKAIYHSLAEYYTTKKVYLIDTLDPEYLSFVKKRTSPQDSVIIVISKSGQTVEVIENLLYFENYPKVIVTSGGVLKEMAEQFGWEMVKHPPIGGRFSTGTESALLPAAMIYVDTRSIREGITHGENEYSRLAKESAIILHYLENNGFTEVYAPNYSKGLSGANELFTQLMHETVCKSGKGQTFLFMNAPECQHHTNQRFFDGRKNIAGLFLKVLKARVDNNDSLLKVDYRFSQMILDNDLRVGDLNNESLNNANNHECLGVMAAAMKKKIPFITLSLDAITPFSVGELIGFFHELAYYSAIIRGVNPFDQPGVELSKALSRAFRKKIYK